MVERSESSIEGKSGLSKLAIKNIRRAINTHRARSKMIEMATKPTVSIDWGEPLVREVGSNTLEELLRGHRITGVTSVEYGALVRKLQEYIRCGEMQIPERWNLRVLCSEQYQLEQALGWGKIQKMVTTFASNGAPATWGLALWPNGQITQIGKTTLPSIGKASFGRHPAVGQKFETSNWPGQNRT